VTGWRAIAEAVLREAGSTWATSPPADKTATTATTSTAPRPEGSFVSIGGFGSGDEAERAAIIEFDGGVPREWAEGLARLLSSPPPAGVAPSLWHARVNRAARFCGAWAVKAAACGWSASDLFGLHPVAPLSRHDGMGVAFFCAEREVIDVTPDAVVIRLANGVRHRIGKRPNPYPPAWTLAG
jgi:hypothetical protein